MAREEELRDIPIPHVSVSGQRSTFSVKSRLTLSGILVVLGLAPLWSQNQQLPLDSSNPLQSAFAYPFTLPPREVERDLTRAMRQIDEQQPLEGLKLLQGLLETREDLLIPPENIAIPVLSQSLKRRVIDIMSKIPAEAFLTYEEQFGGEASVTIAEYRSRDDWEGLSQLSLKYLFTEAGQRLTEEIAERNFDHGNFISAALMFERFLVSCRIRKTASPRTVAVLALCYLQLGQRNQALAVLEREEKLLGKGSIEWGDRRWELPLPPASLLELLAEVRLPVQDAIGLDWAVPRQSTDRNSFSQTGPPALQEKWSISTGRWKDVLESDSGPGDRSDPQDPLDDLFHRSLIRNQSLIPAASPLIVGDLAVLRSVRQLQGVDLVTGKIRWRSAEVEPSLSHLFGDLTPSTQQAGTAQQKIVSAIETRTWDNPSHGAISSDGLRVYSLENLGFWDNSDGPNNFHESHSFSPREYNRLLAHDVRTGKILWEAGGPEHAATTPLAGYCFLGPPLALNGTLYILGEFQHDLHLLAMDPANGQKLWSQTLVSIPQILASDQHRRTGGLSPIAVDGIVLCPTGIHVMVAVDVTSRSILWAARTEDPELFLSEGGIANALIQQSMGTENSLPILNRWIDTHLQLVRDRILFSPRESDELLCLDLWTGKRIWSLPREQRLFVAGSSAGKVLVVSSDVVEAFNIEDGRRAWKGTLPVTAASGRGYFEGNLYHLPLMNGELLSLNVDQGQILVRRQSRGEKPLGNLVAGREIVLSQSYDSITAFRSLSSHAEEQGIALKKEPMDAPGWYLRGLLNLYQLKPEQAYADFKHSWNMGHEVSVLDTWFGSLMAGIEKDPESYRPLIHPEDSALAAKSRWGGLWAYHASLELIQRSDQKATVEFLLRFLPESKTTVALDRVSSDRAVHRTNWITGNLKKAFRAAPQEQIPVLEQLIREEWKRRDTNPADQRQLQMIVRDLDIGRELALADLQRETATLTLERELWLLRILKSPDPALHPPAVAQLALGLLRRGDKTGAIPYLNRLQADFRDQAVLGNFTGAQVLQQWKNDLKPAHEQTLLKWPEGKVIVEKRQLSNQDGTPGVPIPLFIDLRFPAPPRMQIVRNAERLQAFSSAGKFLWEHPLHHNYGYNAGGQWYYAPIGSMLVLTNTIQFSGIDLSRVDRSTEAPRLWNLELIDTQGTYYWNDPAGNQGPFNNIPVRPQIIRNSAHQSGGTLLSCTEELIVFYRDQTLSGIDPLTGMLRWQRFFTKSPPEVFSYGQRLFLRADPKDPAQFSVLSTTDGEIIEQHSWSNFAVKETGPLIRPFRNIAITPTPEGIQVIEQMPDQKFRLALIDPWTIKTRWEKYAPQGSRFTFGQRAPSETGSLPGPAEIAILSPGGAFQILKPGDGTPRMQMTLPEIDVPSAFTLISTPENDLLFFETIPILSTAAAQFAWGRGSLPCGEAILALDKIKQSVAWKRAIPAKSELLEVNGDHPLLVLVTNKQRENPGSNGRLAPSGRKMLVLDRRNGREIYSQEDPVVISQTKMQLDSNDHQLKFRFAATPTDLELNIKLTNETAGNGSPDVRETSPKPLPEPSRMDN